MFFSNPIVAVLFGGIGTSVSVEIVKFIRGKKQERCRQWNVTLGNDIEAIKLLLNHAPLSKLQHEYLHYLNKYKDYLSNRDVEMLIRQESISKGKPEELLNVLLGLLEALQLKEYR